MFQWYARPNEPHFAPLAIQVVLLGELGEPLVYFCPLVFVGLVFEPKKYAAEPAIMKRLMNR